MSFSWNDILNPIKNVLATGYKLTRTGLTDLFTDSAALGREVGDLIFKHKLIPFYEAIQDVETQSVRNTPVFSPLSNLGIKTGSQLFNAESQLASTFIPITGTFGHLAAHPNEPLPQKISDIAFGILDIPSVVELGDFTRALIRGSEELSPIGRVAAQIGKSKAFYVPLSAIGLGSTILSSFSNPSPDQSNYYHTNYEKLTTIASPNSHSYLDTFSSNQNFNQSNISYIQNGNSVKQSAFGLNTLFTNNKNRSDSTILLIILFILLIAMLSLIIVK
ncbi:hypothetical protein [Saccharolobus shibatae]|uniref:Uncharacterized protein n=1 Tax=Saccharolobus shibatae TaxID=2286 RepID=A0A8F5BS94_9CREN|nr:hypothetical protein [Saccharolobus shibatae]QXJ30543.1 hypothetical protein J5U21_00186 [Saccharolobus shibatae]